MGWGCSVVGTEKQDGEESGKNNHLVDGYPNFKEASKNYTPSMTQGWPRP
jgi:hypothetical protein